MSRKRAARDARERVGRRKIMRGRRVGEYQWGEWFGCGGCGILNGVGGKVLVGVRKRGTYSVYK